MGESGSLFMSVLQERPSGMLFHTAWSSLLIGEWDSVLMCPSAFTRMYPADALSND